MPANPFDLEGKTLTFTPRGAGYAVEVGGPSWEDPGRGPAVATHRLNGLESVTVELRFPFSYAGQTWTRLFANANGHLSFQRPEHENWQERDNWSDATMRSQAAAVDSRAAAGAEAMIAALWQTHGDTALSVDSTPARVVITWRAHRPTPGYAHHAPLGENLFQARLYPSGMVEFAYRAIAERDGFVGLFHGQNGLGSTLGAADDRAGDTREAMVDITEVELVDAGTTVLARMTLAADVPERVPVDAVDYRIFLQFGDYECAVGLSVTVHGRKPFSFGCGPPPGEVGYQVRNATVELWFSKTRLHGADRFSWDADAVWWGQDDYDHIPEAGTVRVDLTELDLGARAGAVNGNAFEVFHYPVFPKQMHQVTSYIYRQAPEIDEIAVLFTDFRVDDLYGHGPGSGTLNDPILGIGSGPEGAGPHDAPIWGSDRLLVTMSPLFLGGRTSGPRPGLAAAATIGASPRGSGGSRTKRPTVGWPAWYSGTLGPGGLRIYGTMEHTGAIGCTPRRCFRYGRDSRVRRTSMSQSTVGPSGRTTATDVHPYRKPRLRQGPTGGRALRARPLRDGDAGAGRRSRYLHPAPRRGNASGRNCPGDESTGPNRGHHRSHGAAGSRGGCVPEGVSARRLPAARWPDAPAGHGPEGAGRVRSGRRVLLPGYEWPHAGNPESRRRTVNGRRGPVAAPSAGAPRPSVAPLWSPPVSRWRTRPSPVQRRPSARSRTPSGSSVWMPWSASRTTRRPEPLPAAASTRRWAGSWPSRRDHSRRRRGLGATPNVTEAATEGAGFGAVDPWIGGGSPPAPFPAQRRRMRFGSMRANRSGVMGFGERPRHETVSRPVSERGVCPSDTRKATPVMTPARANHSREAGRRPPLGPGRPDA